ncbi:MAG: hypothetical protein IJD79_09330 [Clostridia bacterium]|nr:hypothetical protein [Clostridia bacterium]
MVTAEVIERAMLLISINRTAYPGYVQQDIREFEDAVRLGTLTERTVDKLIYSIYSCLLGREELKAVTPRELCPEEHDKKTDNALIELFNLLIPYQSVEQLNSNIIRRTF